MKKVLITGGAGFIGYHLAFKLIKLNYEVFLMDNFSRGKLDKNLKKLLKEKKIKLIKHNLNNDIKIKNNFTHIFHLAAIVGVKNVNKDPYKTILNNLIPLIKILNFTKKNNSKIIFFSTSEIYSPLIDRNLIKFPLGEENDLLVPKNVRPRDSYFLSKLFCEKILQSSNNDYVILRPHNIYGPRMGYSHVIPELIKKLSVSKVKIQIFSPSHKRAFCYIDDAITQIIELSFNKKNNKLIFNIGNPKEEIKIFDLAKKIQFYLGKKNLIKKGKITEGSPSRRIPNMKKTISKINLKNFTNLNSGLLKTINWYLNEKN